MVLFWKKKKRSCGTFLISIETRQSKDNTGCICEETDGQSTSCQRNIMKSRKWGRFLSPSCTHSCANSNETKKKQKKTNPHGHKFACTVTLRGYFSQFLLSHCALTETSNFLFEHCRATWSDSPLWVTLSPLKGAYNRIQEGLVSGSCRWAFSPACKTTRTDAQTHTHARALLRMHSPTPLAYQRGKQYHPTCSAIYHCGPGTALQGLRLWTRWASKGKEQSLPEPWKRGKAA